MNKLAIIGVLIIIFGGIFVFWQSSKNSDEASTVNDYQSPTMAPTKVVTPATINEKLLVTNIPKNEMKSFTQATLRTNKGDITIKLNSLSTPNTVLSFVTLAQKGFYNGTKFHRVIKGFMNQGGDPFSKDDSLKDRWGTGGPGYTFKDEIQGDNSNDIGTISMANAGPNTNGSQFFINVVNNSSLNDKHTVFGKVISGLEVVNAINNVATDKRDRPLEPVIIESIDLK